MKKIGICLLVSLGLPSLMHAQTQVVPTLTIVGSSTVTPTTPNLTVDPNGNNTTAAPTLQVNGDIVVQDDATATGPALILQYGMTSLTGDFVVNSKILVKNHVFYEGVGGPNPNSNFTTQVTDGSGAVNTKGTIAFTGVGIQSIKRLPGSGVGAAVPNFYAADDYINFPNIEVALQNGGANLNSPASVVVDPYTAISLNQLKLTQGKLVLDSKNGDLAGNSPLTTSYTARMLVRDLVAYNRTSNHFVTDFSAPTQLDATVGSTAADPAGTAAQKTTWANYNQNGVVEVRLALSDVAGGADRNGYFFGVTSPYDAAKFDYFTGNIIMRPAGSNLFGVTGKTIWDITGNRDPDTKTADALLGESAAAGTSEHAEMLPGYGYLCGQAIYGSGYDPATNHPSVKENGTNPNFGERFKTKLIFNRYAFEAPQADVEDATNNPKSLEKYCQTAVYFQNPATLKGAATDGSQYTGHDPYTDENIRTADTPVNLQQGFNFLANPYTTALSLDYILNGGTDPGWGVVPGTDVDSKFYVIGSSYTDIMHPNFVAFSLSVNYLVCQPITGTYNLASNGTPVLAPLQMFVLESAAKQTMKIPAGARTHDVVGFLKKSPATVNELLIQAVEEDTQKDDRLVLGFRSKSEYAVYRAKYNAPKIQNADKGLTQMFTLDKTTATPLTSNNLPYPEPGVLDSIGIRLIPAKVAKKMTLNAYRVSSLSRNIPEVWLQDTQKSGLAGYTPIKTADLNFVDKVQTTYAYDSKPTDPVNRFVLWFAEPKDAQGIDGGGTVDNNMRAYYADGTLTVSGIESMDLGSKLEVYDMQGHKMYNSTLDQVGSIERQAYLAAGVYVLRIDGKRLLNVKILAK